jgi:uncharacterized protein with von Willebrand factor type A (vWA) domain
MTGEQYQFLSGVQQGVDIRD